MDGNLGGRYKMQKVYISKETHEVVQLIQEDYKNFTEYTEATFGEDVYLVVLEDEKHIDGHNYRYNLIKEEFEIIEDYKEVEIAINADEDLLKEIKALREENKYLKDVEQRLKRIENVLGIK